MNPFDLLKNSQAIKEQLEKTKDEISEILKKIELYMP